MKAESFKDFNDALDTYSVSLDDFKSDEWKDIVVNHAHGTRLDIFQLKSHFKYFKYPLHVFLNICL